jgi:2,3-bisphosphoglycerate-independent phosphoglycerate mutase
MISSKAVHRPIVLVIRDGWGANPYPEWNHANAVFLAKKPVDDRLMAEFPHVLVKTCGNHVGLPGGVMGNSEVGHQNIGAGRIVEQEIMRITGRIRDGEFFQNRALLAAFEYARKTGGRVHILGLCSDGRVHSDLDHLYGLLELGRRVRFPGDHVAVHAFTDGRDTSPTCGVGFILEVEKRCKELGVAPVASVVGRYYAMDRDNRWERIETAYRMLVHGEGRRFDSAVEAVRHYYDHPSEPSRAGDEFIVPSVVGKPATIRDGDSVIFFNYRGDRPRQLTKAFTYDSFPFLDSQGRKQGFERGRKLDVHFVSLTAYEEGLPVHVAFEKPPRMEQILGAILAERGLRQFRCAETEKYAHVTFFFNDYRDDPFPGEERLLVPSPKSVSTYDQKPEMSAYEVTDALVKRIASGVDDFILVNYANGDMVGHTGNLRAAVRAVEAVDECVGKVVDAVVARDGGLIVTADHGNCEQMIDPATGGPHTAHTTYDVELIVVDPRYRGRKLRPGGRLADIAPTALYMIGLGKPNAMTGSSLMVD